MPLCVNIIPTRQSRTPQAKLHRFVASKALENKEMLSVRELASFVKAGNAFFDRWSAYLFGSALGVQGDITVMHPNNIAIPRIGSIDDVNEYLDCHPHEDVDISTLYRPMGTVDDVLAEEQILTAKSDSLAVNDAVAQSIHDRMKRQQRYIDYEAVFFVPGLQRRSQRQTLSVSGPVSHSVKELIGDWFSIILADSQVKGQQDRRVPDDLSDFQELMKYHLPTRLDADSWVARELVQWQNIHTMYDLPSGELRAWEPWMNGANPLVLLTADGYKECFGPRKAPGPSIYFGAANPYLGVGKAGHFVFYHPQGFPKPSTSRAVQQDHMAKQVIRVTEAFLISFSRRIARIVVVDIVHSYIQPVDAELGRTPMTREEVAKATREILGQSWLDLPFDDLNLLRRWSENDVLKPQAIIRQKRGMGRSMLLGVN